MPAPVSKGEFEAREVPTLLLGVGIHRFVNREHTTVRASSGGCQNATNRIKECVRRVGHGQIAALPPPEREGNAYGNLSDEQL
jgi:hypothetical protein